VEGRRRIGGPRWTDIAAVISRSRSRYPSCSTDTSTDADPAFRRLTHEESRLSGIARRLNVGGPHGEAPDAAAVAISIREADAIGSGGE
jgi:hypothetical protein